MSRQAVRLMALVIAILVGIAIAFALVSLVVRLFNDPVLVGEDGELTEPTYVLPADVPLPVFTDVTEEWGLDDWVTRGENRLRGGVAIGDLDADGRNDVIVAGGALVAYLNRTSHFDRVVGPNVGDAVSVSLSDLTDDGFPDALVGTRYSPAKIVWGGDWVGGPQSDGFRGMTSLGSVDAFTLALVAQDLNGDGARDLVQLDYDGPDIVWEAVVPGVRYDPIELPNSDRQSMTLALGDVDDDGLTDVWVTRDVGWVTGADSVYSRKGEAAGRFTDIARDIGADLKIDGMGITLADLNLDGELDAYIADLGDNELLAGGADGFTKETESGLAHIRPIGAPESIISSSWTSAATDVNHDGLLDLVVANGGFVGEMVPNKIEGSEIADKEAPSVFISRGDGTYVDVWPELGIDWAGYARGMAVGDLDGDDDADIVIVEHSGSLIVLRNDTPGPVTRLDAADCSAVRLDVETEPRPEAEGGVGGRASLVVPAHGFLSSHSPEVSIGGTVTSVLVDGRAIELGAPLC